jgi:predicted O-linked N-acetylglucosamine transferase (SPINDLY family)
VVLTRSIQVSATLGERFVSLHGLSVKQAAAAIAARGIQLLVDLNGLTMHSGLPIMAYRPAPVQISFLVS